MLPRLRGAVCATLLIGLLAASALAAGPAAAPEGVRAIDLREMLHGEEGPIQEVWLLSPRLCVLHTTYWEAAGFELVVVDLEQRTVLSRTPFAQGTVSRPVREGGALSLLLQLDGADQADAPATRLMVRIDPQGGLSQQQVPADRTLMPGNRTAIREAPDGSLYAVDVGTGAEELLLQGVPDGLAPGTQKATYEVFQRYVPCADDVGYHGIDPYGDPLPFSLPLDEQGFYENELWLWRAFRVVRPLDEHRFVYAVSGWEWGAGYGVYDLKARADHRITGRGDFFGVYGNTLIGSHLAMDATAYEGTFLPEAVQQQLAAVNAMEDGLVSYDVSPDGRLLALAGLRSRQADAHAATVTDLLSGDLVQALDLPDSQLIELGVSFCGDACLGVLTGTDEEGIQYLYLAEVGKQ